MDGREGGREGGTCIGAGLLVLPHIYYCSSSNGMDPGRGEIFFPSNSQVLGSCSPESHFLSVSDTKVTTDRDKHGQCHNCDTSSKPLKPLSSVSESQSPHQSRKVTGACLPSPRFLRVHRVCTQWGFLRVHRVCTLWGLSDRKKTSRNFTLWACVVMVLQDTSENHLGSQHHQPGKTLSAVKQLYVSFYLQLQVKGSITSSYRQKIK